MSPLRELVAERQPAGPADRLGDAIRVLVMLAYGVMSVVFAGCFVLLGLLLTPLVPLPLPSEKYSAVMSRWVLSLHAYQQFRNQALQVMAVRGPFARMAAHLMLVLREAWRTPRRYREALQETLGVS